MVGGKCAAGGGCATLRNKRELPRTGLEIIDQIDFDRGRDRDRAVAADLVETGEAKSLRALVVGEMKSVALEAIGWLGVEDDPALAALAVPPAVVVKIEPVAIEDLEKQMTGIGLDLAKVLDLDSAFL